MSRVYKHKGSYDFFNLLRIGASVVIACFMHFRTHFCRTLELVQPFKQGLLWWFASSESQVLVELFFIISGMLFVLVYLPRIEQRRYNLDSFVMHRVVRMYPLAILTTLVVFTLQQVLFRAGFGLWGVRGSTDLVDLFLEVTMAGKAAFGLEGTNNSPIWYINILMVCTAVAYLLALFYRDGHSKLVFVLPIFLGLCIFYHNPKFMLLNMKVARGMVAFFVGCILEFCLQRIDGLRRSAKVLLCALCATTVAFSVWYLVYHKGGHETYVGNLFLYVDFYLFPALIILLYHCPHLNRICAAKPFAFLNNISFGVYLWNLPILCAAHSIIMFNSIDIAYVQEHILGLWAILFAAHFMVATVSYYAFEKPITRYLVGIVNAQQPEVDDAPKSRHAARGQ